MDAALKDSIQRGLSDHENRDDAQDAIQDAWMKAYMHLDTFDGRAKFSTWLARIAINSSLMIHRRKRARPETSMEIKDGDTGRHWEIADQTKNVEELYAHERVEHLNRAICRLHPTLRNVVEIRQSNDLSVKRSRRARRHLRCRN
jgi:RNA polymerase sigma-70 factor, ECF subfamily